MIIQVRGTSGSGKSTLVRRVMEMYGGVRLKIKREKRRQPFAYLLTRKTEAPSTVAAGRQLVVLGHYESPCGGCDTIKTYDEIFAAVREADSQGYDVLFEGLLMSTDKTHIAKLAGEYPDHLIVGLDVPIDECLASINKRRREKKPDAEDVNPKGTTSKHGTNKRAMAQFQADGLNAEWHDRDSAFTRICEALGL